MSEYKDLANGIREFLRLRTLPLAIKFLEKTEDIQSIEKVRRPENNISWCQAVGLSRNLGWTIAVTEDDLVTPACAFKLGFGYMPGQYYDLYVKIWVKTKEDSIKYINTLPSLLWENLKLLLLHLYLPIELHRRISLISLGIQSR
jgi:uncharacterized protein (DUF169 family)